MTKPVAIAIAAHPDDIEFLMAGTLLLLRRSGWETHYFDLAAGNCGSVRYSSNRTRAIRRREARNAALVLDAIWHPPICDDLEIFYELSLLRRVAAVIREVRPSIVLTHSPQDYMEDHTNTCRLAVTAAFARGMPNFKTAPRRAHFDREIAIYHAMPHGMHDGLRQLVVPDAFVNTRLVQKIKRQALACHRSQKDWLDISQGMGSYVRTMDDMSRTVGRMSRSYEHAEGWRRHSHLGFARETWDPLRDALGRDHRRNRGRARIRAGARGL